MIAGKGNNLASPPYFFCQVSLDAGGTGDTVPGELGKYVEGSSSNDQSDQTKLRHDTGFLALSFPRSLGSGVYDKINGGQRK